MKSEKKIINAMSVDVEDYFHVSAFEGSIDRANWDKLECRVEQNTYKSMELFSDAGVKATFFVLGWVAERYPSLIKEIIAQGHELASHGFSHQRIHFLTQKEFREEIKSTKALLEEIGGIEVTGYRAPSYSIVKDTLWAHDILAEEGYRYSSSVYPVVHDLYGIPDAPRFSYKVARNQLLEIPVSTIRFMGRNWPCGGGGYFRLFPYELSKKLILQVNNHEKQPGLFYFHPWELDPNQPRQKNINMKSRFRHYLNLKQMEGRLQRLLEDFRWGRMDEVFLNESK